jgi:hypothetical protein
MKRSHAAAQPTQPKVSTKAVSAEAQESVLFDVAPSIVAPNQVGLPSGPPGCMSARRGRELPKTAGRPLES